MKSWMVTVCPLTLLTVPAMPGVGLWPFSPAPPKGPRNPKPNRPGPPCPGPGADSPGSANDWAGSLDDADWLAAAGAEVAELELPEPEVAAHTIPKAPPARPTAAAPSPTPLERQPGRQCRPHLPALLEVPLAGLADHGHRLLGAAPLQPGGDRLHGPHGTGRVVVAVHVQAVGTSGGGVQARIVDLIEEVLEGARDVAQVGGRPEEVAVGVQHVEGRRRQRRSAHHLDILDARIGRARRGGLE